MNNPTKPRSQGAAVPCTTVVFILGRQLIVLFHFAPQMRGPLPPRQLSLVPARLVRRAELPLRRADALPARGLRHEAARVREPLREEPRLRPRRLAQLPQRGALPAVRRADGEEVLRGTRGSLLTSIWGPIII